MCFLEDQLRAVVSTALLSPSLASRSRLLLFWKQPQLLSSTPRPLVPALLQWQQPPAQEAGKEKVQSAAGLATWVAGLGPAGPSCGQI